MNVNKTDIDNLIRISRKCMKSYNADLIKQKDGLIKQISNQLFGNNTAGYDFVCVVCSMYPCVVGCSHQKIYDIFKLINIDVVEGDDYQ